MADRVQPAGWFERHRQKVLQNHDTHPVTVAVRRLGTGTVAVTLATSTMVATVISEKFPKTRLHNALMIVLYSSCFLMWVGDIYRNLLGLCCQMLGLSLALVVTAAIMGVFLPFAFTTACIAIGAMCALPMLDVIIRPRAGAPADDDDAAAAAGGA